MSGLHSARRPQRVEQGRHEGGRRVQLPGRCHDGQGGGCRPGRQVYPAQGRTCGQILRHAFKQNIGKSIFISSFWYINLLLTHQSLYYLSSTDIFLHYLSSIDIYLYYLSSTDIFLHYLSSIHIIYISSMDLIIQDTGVSVRKRVIKILKDICLEFADYRKIPEICVKMIRRLVAIFLVSKFFL